MKRILSLILVLVLALTVMVGCDKIPGLDKIKLPGLPDLFPGNDTDDKNDNITYDVAAAVEYVRSLYIKGASTTESGAVITPDDYEVVAQVRVAGVVYTVDWTVDNDKVKLTKGETAWTVDVDSKAAEAHDYKLTATVKAGDGTTGTISFNRHVPKYNVLSFEEYMAAEKGTTVTIEGIVVAMNGKSVGNSRNHLFLADANTTGGYYCYQLDNDPVEAGVKVGMTVSVTAVVEPYSGMQELKGGTFAIVDETIKTVSVLDITEKFAAGADLKNYVGLAVTVKGVTIGSQDMSKDSSQYLYFSLNGKEGYVRTYVTDFPTTLTIVTDGSKVTSPDKTTIDEAHAAKFGWTANATGILILYNGNPYLVPMGTDCFEYLEFVEKTPEEKIAAELGGLTFDSTITSDKVIDLVLAGANYTDVAFAWASNNDAVVIADGKATVTIPNEAVTVQITVTATCDGKSDTKVFEVKLSKSLTSIPAIIEIAKGLTDKGDPTTDKYLVAGIITEIKNETYGNLYIKDAEGNTLYIYGLYDADGVRYDKMEVKPAVGDYIVVLSVVGHYNEPQLKNATVVSHSTPISIPSAVEIANGLTDKGDPTADKYLVTGEITEIKSDKYGNMYIKDAEGNTLYIYGLYSEDGTVRYDSMEVKPAVGDTITVLSVIGLYNDPQLKNAWVVSHTVASSETPGGDNTDPGTSTEQNKADVTFADLGWENSKQYTSYDIDANITATTSGTAVGNYGLSTGKYYTTGNGWRIYQAESAQLTITAKNGATIVSVKVTYTVDKTGILTKDGANVESDAVVTVNGTSVTFGVGNTGTATNGQVRISAIEVLYTGGTPVEPKPETPAHNCVDANGDYKCDSADCNKAVAPAADSTLTIPQAIALANALGANQYTTNKYYITATIVDVYNDQYGNMNVKDADGNTYVFYGAYDKDGNRYDAMATKPVAGDTVTMYGVVGSYQKNADSAISYQLKNGTVTAHTAVNPDQGGNNDNTETDPNALQYTFSQYTAGTQYAENEVHNLDDNTTVTVTQGHFTTQLRLYSSSEHNAFAVIHSVKAVTKLSVNAGNKADNLVVYGSNDGTTWVEIGKIATTSSYADYTLDLNGSYNYIKLDVEGTNQVRVASFTLTVA